MKRILCLICLLIMLVPGIQRSYAQDPHFSQYFASPMTLNPALIGKGVENMRISFVLRSQWWGNASIDPYYTSTFSFEKRLATAKPGNNNLAIAASMLSDASGGGLLKNNFLSFGIAYNKALDAEGNEMLGGGLSVTYANRIFDAGKFQFQSQYGSMGFQRSAPSNDAVSISGRHYWDVNAGIRYSKTTKNIGYDLGLSVFHAGTPREAQYNNEDYNLDRRISFQSGLRFYFSNKNQLHITSVFEKQGSNNIYTAGGVYKIHCNDETVASLNIGIWDRFGDALYPYVAVEGNNWLAGITYDIVNTKDKTWAESVESLEFSFVLKFGSVKQASSSVKNVVYY